MGHDLENPLYIPSFVEHRNSDYPLNRAVGLVHIRQLMYIWCVVVNYKNLIFDGVGRETCFFDQKPTEFFRHILTLGYGLSHDNRQRQQFPAIKLAPGFFMSVAD